MTLAAAQACPTYEEERDGQKYKVTRFGTLHLAFGIVMLAVALPVFLVWETYRGCSRCVEACCPSDEPKKDRVDLVRLKAVLAANPSAARDHIRPGVPALVATADLGEAGALALLLQSGAPPDSVITAECKNSEMVGTSALYLAAQNGFTECARALLAAGANPNLAEPDLGKTPLIAAVESRKADAVAVLLAAGANPNQTASEKLKSATPLLVAARNGYPELVGVLLAGGAAVCVNGLNALAAAVMSDNADCVAKLLEAGAPTVQVHDGQSFELVELAKSAKVRALLGTHVATAAAARPNPLYAQ